jgi:hypothetical protein
MKAMAKFAGTIALLALATVTTGCGSSGGTTDVAAPVNTVSASTLDRYSAQDLKFFEPVRPGEGAMLVRQPASLAAALKRSTATVVATVNNVKAGRIIHDLQFIEVELKVTEVIEGALRPELKGVVRVEFVGTFLPGSVDPMVDAMRANLPQNPSVWLLRWQGEPPAIRKPGAPAEDATADKTLYRVVHPNSGVFTQGEDSVVAATAQDEMEAGAPQGAQLEGEKFGKLSELVTRVRKG